MKYEYLTELQKELVDRLVDLELMDEDEACEFVSSLKDEEITALLELDDDELCERLGKKNRIRATIQTHRNGF